MKSQFRQMVENKVNASVNKMQEETIQNPEETIKELEEIIKVLQIQKEDKKLNYIQNLKDKLRIRYKDYINWKRDYENGKIPDELYIQCLDITLGKVFGILKDNGVSFD